MLANIGDFPRWAFRGSGLRAESLCTRPTRSGSVLITWRAHARKHCRLESVAAAARTIRHVRPLMNRLMRTDARVGGVLTETTGYEYNAEGNVGRIVRRVPGLTTVTATRFEYDRTGHVWRTSRYANPGTEYRYAGGQRRYLLRQKDAQTGEWHDVQWSDYVGNSIYADYTVTEGVPTETRGYMPGLWETDLTTQPAQTFFLHTDLLGSVRLMSDQEGAMITDGDGGGLQHYTAFGEPFVIMSDGTYLQNLYQLPTRYGYAGSSGYENLSALSTRNSALLHLGERFYNPGLGRFLQRDPIGIGGGLGVYGYVRNSPLSRVDPTGEWNFLGSVVGGVIGGVIGGVVGGLTGGWAGAAAGAIGGIVTGALAGSGVVPPAVAGAVGGLLSGGLNSYWNGGSFWNGAAVGGALGGVTGGVGGYFGGRIQDGFGWVYGRFAGTTFGAWVGNALTTYFWKVPRRLLSCGSNILNNHARDIDALTQ